jgi:hypothetical protein
VAVRTSARRSSLVGDHRIGLLGPIAGERIGAVVGALAYISISFSTVPGTVGRFRLRSTVRGWELAHHDPARA